MVSNKFTNSLQEEEDTEAIVAEKKDMEAVLAEEVMVEEVGVEGEVGLEEAADTAVD